MDQWTMKNLGWNNSPCDLVRLSALMADMRACRQGQCMFFHKNNRKGIDNA